MTGLFGAYLTGTGVGVVIGAVATVAVVLHVLNAMDRATTTPAVAQPPATVIDLAGRRSTRSWSA